jgi:uncharacterized membrane protein
MMFLKFVLLYQLIGFGIIAGQAFYYLVCFTNVLRDLPAREYTLMRQTIDRHIGKPFRFIYITMLLSCLLAPVLLFTTIGHEARNWWWYAAMLCFFADFLLALKGNNPINKIIAGWQVDNPPANWSEYRTKWAQFFAYRQVLAIGGLVSLIMLLLTRVSVFP